MSQEDAINQLYQEMILEHNKKPRNFQKLVPATHTAEGFNPVCGDHYTVYLRIGTDEKIEAASFEGSGCAISKASASMMTQALIGKTRDQADVLFDEFHRLLLGKLNPDKDQHNLGKLKIFSGIWKFPARVKCAGLSWHAMNSALKGDAKVTTE